MVIADIKLIIISSGYLNTKIRDLISLTIKKRNSMKRTFKHLPLKLLLISLIIPFNNVYADSCKNYLRDMFYSSSPYEVLGSGIKSRNDLGYAFYSSRPFLIKQQGDRLQGSYLMAFSDRSDGKKDRVTLKISRKGQVALTLNSWNNTPIRLSNLSCYRGHKKGDFILSGIQRSKSHGVGIYNFVFSSKEPRCDLIPHEYNSCGNKANFTRFWFDQRSNSCKSFSFGGCWNTTPFNSLQECEKTCR